MNKFEERLKIRDTQVDGTGPWYWLDSDNGAWDGPSKEFSQIKDAAFEFIKEPKVCVQAGGNLGLYPRLFSKYFNYVYTFEPDPLNFYILSKNCQVENIFKFNAGLSNRAEMKKLYLHSAENVGMHSMSDERQYAQHVPAVTMRLDDLYLDRCDYMQLDVENYELQALEGAMATILQHRPVISVETYDEKVKSFFNYFASTTGIAYEYKKTVVSDHFLVAV